MNGQSKKGASSFAFKLSTNEVPWEHEERTVYTVETIREEMKARLAPPSGKEKKPKSGSKSRAAKA